MASKHTLLNYLVLSIALGIYPAHADDRIVAVEKYYRLKSEVGIYGVVTKRTGTRVVFQPCSGSPKEIDDSEIESTDNTCIDGRGKSFAQLCKGSGADQEIAQNFFTNSQRVEVGSIYVTIDGKLQASDTPLLDAMAVTRIETCSGSWAVGLDSNGSVLTKMLSLERSKLLDSKTLEFRKPLQ